MPYKMRTEGMEELTETLRALGESAESVASMALFEGAGTMADTIKKSAEDINTEPFRYARPGERRLPSPEEKEIILSVEGKGIAKFRHDGDGVSTSVGYSNAGYAELGNKTVPIPLIVNAVNSGTSFRIPQPFMRKAVSSGRKKAEKVMTEKVESEWAKMMKETEKFKGRKNR